MLWVYLSEFLILKLLIKLFTTGEFVKAFIPFDPLGSSSEIFFLRSRVGPETPQRCPSACWCWSCASESRVDNILIIHRLITVQFWHLMFHHCSLPYLSLSFFFFNHLCSTHFMHPEIKGARKCRHFDTLLFSFRTFLLQGQPKESGRLFWGLV